MRAVKVMAVAPATVANVGPGFDIFGLALSQPVDRVTLTTNSSGEITLSSQMGTEPTQNAAGVVLLRLLAKYPLANTGFHIQVDKGMEVGTGMGSSAASGAAAAKAFEEVYWLICGERVKLEDLLEACVHAESVCAGSRHGDNCLPAYLGGFILVIDVSSAPQYHRISIPSGLIFLLFKPDIAILTSAARAILPADVSLKSRICTSAHCAGMVYALSQGNLASFCEHIVITDIEEARSALIPRYGEARRAAVEAGAMAFSISGSGPAVFAVTTEERGNWREIVTAVVGAFQGNVKVFRTTPSNEGAKVVHSEIMA